MSLALGVDTGGTYTDAVLFDQNAGRVLAWSKALTSYDDLSRGVGQAMAAAFATPGAPRPDQIELVGLSTTLATNAAVEGVSAHAGLVLIGYDQQMLIQRGIQSRLPARRIFHVAGGHRPDGSEAAPLDLAGLEEALRKGLDGLEAVGVSGYFSVKNPAHELAARDLVTQVTGLPVTCGHELTSKLDSIRRAATVGLNAGLVPLIQDLIAKVRASLEALGVSGRLMVVRGDGGLVAADWASRRPIETLLSGPAASAVGAWHLCQATGQEPPARLWVADMGGTTTDIAHLENGRPRLSPDGARVGQWLTMVEAVDVHTQALGGDSQVSVDRHGALCLGPRRATPLCLLAGHREGITEELSRQRRALLGREVGGQFLVAEIRPRQPLAGWEGDLLVRLAKGPLSVLQWEDMRRSQGLMMPRLDDLMARRVVGMAAFTPTDALHVLGELDLWPAEASRLGAEILAQRFKISAVELSRRVVEMARRRAAAGLAGKALAEEGLDPAWDQEPLARRLLDKALGAADEAGLGAALRLNGPVAGIGAPAEAFLPQAARMLSTDYVTVPHAGVANAVGAVAGGVALRRRVELRPSEDGTLVRAFMPQGVGEFTDLEEAVAQVRAAMTVWLADQAREAGACQVQVSMTRADQTVCLPGAADVDLYLGSQLDFLAVGRPAAIC